MKKIEGGISDSLDSELGEDAPLIAGIVDERPITIQAEERYGSYRWKTIGADADETHARKTVEKARNESDSDQSLPGTANSASIRRRHDSESDSDMSPPRKTVRNDVEERQDSDSDAGLQSGSSLRAKRAYFRQRETEMFHKLDNSVSGRGAATIVRDKRTGRKENLMEEEHRIREITAKMDKPLARYANDVDLDKYLRAQERDGDPMLKCRKKKDPRDNPTVVDDQDGKPRYGGCAAPNRFKIRPGVRWDGVDRSSGFEKERFSRLANSQAQELDVYKWSVEDM